MSAQNSDEVSEETSVTTSVTSSNSFSETESSSDDCSSLDKSDGRKPELGEFPVESYTSDFWSKHQNREPNIETSSMVSSNTAPVSFTENDYSSPLEKGVKYAKVTLDSAIQGSKGEDCKRARGIYERKKSLRIQGGK